MPQATSAPPMIPLCRPTIEEDEIAAVVAVMRSGWLTTGPQVMAFEAALKERLGARHALTLGSATAGLHCVLAALDVGPGDEVITASMTWPSVVNAIELLGARPVFADVDPDTLIMDPAHVARLLGARTRAVVPVHYAGQPADLDALEDLLAGTGVGLVEDAAHAIGTEYRGREIGAGGMRAGRSAVFSFHPIKNLTTGEGGAVMTDDDTLAERVRLLRFHGVSKDAWARNSGTGSPRYEVVRPGFKANMLDLEAAIGVVQLGKLDRFNAARGARAERYTAMLSDVPEIRPLGRVDYPHVHAWHLFIVQLDLEALTVDRDGFIEELRRRGVGAGLHFTPVHEHVWYRERYGPFVDQLPATERAGERILSLPLFPSMTDAEQDRVVTAVTDIVAGSRR